MARAPMKERLDGWGRKLVIMEIEEKLLKRIHERRSRMLHVSRKMIRAKGKAMFDLGNVDPAIQDSFVASSSWIQKFMKNIILHAGKYLSGCSYTSQVIVLWTPVAFFIKILMILF